MTPEDANRMMLSWLREHLAIEEVRTLERMYRRPSPSEVAPRAPRLRPGQALLVDGFGRMRVMDLPAFMDRILIPVPTPFLASVDVAAAAPIRLPCAVFRLQQLDEDQQIALYLWAGVE
jgi:hypothetical protein